MNAAPDKTLAFVAEMDFDTPEGRRVLVSDASAMWSPTKQAAVPECGMKLMPMGGGPPPPFFFFFF